MGHEELQAGPEPGVLHPMGQDIIEYDRALCNLLMCVSVCHCMRCINTL